MNLKSIGLLLAIVSLQSLLTIGVARWSFSEQSHATYAAIERLLDEQDVRQQHRMTNIRNIESRLYASEGRILEEVDKRIKIAVQRELRKQNEGQR